jgi:hypothetical protein
MKFQFVSRVPLNRGDFRAEAMLPAPRKSKQVSLKQWCLLERLRLGRVQPRRETIQVADPKAAAIQPASAAWFIIEASLRCSDD